MRARRRRSAIQKLESRIAMSAEHGMMLVPIDQVTVEAVQSGHWTDPAVWGGQTPTDGDRVHIPDGKTVTLSTVEDTELDWVRIDGDLYFQNDVDTQLIAEDVVVSRSGHLKLGLGYSQSVASDKSATLILTTGPVTDSMQMGRGLLVNGQFDAWGADKTDRALVQWTNAAGDIIKLNETHDVSNWRVGDRIAVPQTQFVDDRSTTDVFENENEVRAVAAVLSNNRVRLDRPLDYKHNQMAGEKFWVANLTRNVSIRSSDLDAEIAEKAHVMFAHTNDVKIKNTEFVGLGRTDKSEKLDDWLFDLNNENAAQVQSDASNRRGRYAVHFHRGYMDPINPDGTIIVSGSVVDGSPGWGFVNHSSEVDFKNNVAHDTVGAGFVGEAGDETGIMKWNIAIHMTGSGQLAQEGGAANGRSRKRMDFGHSGHGIWAQGPAIEMEGNVVAGARGTGIWVDGRGVIELDKQPAGERFGDVATALDPNKITWMTTDNYRKYDEPGLFNYEQAVLSDLHPKLFKNNKVHASGIGVHFQRIHGQTPGNTWNKVERTSDYTEDFGTIQGTILANNRIGFSAIYFHNMRVVDTTVVSNTRATAEAAFELDEFASHIEFDTGRIRNYKIGFDFYTDDEKNGQLESWKIGGFTFEYVVDKILDDHGDLIDDIPVEHQLF